MYIEANRYKKPLFLSHQMSEFALQASFLLECSVQAPGSALFTAFKNGVSSAGQSCHGRLLLRRLWVNISASTAFKATQAKIARAPHVGAPHGGSQSVAEECTTYEEYELPFDFHSHHRDLWRQ